MNPIPILYGNREMSFDPDTLEKLKYLNYKAGKQGKNLKERFSPIINEALAEFFDVKLVELNIEPYIDVEAENSKRRYQKMIEGQAREREDRRILQLAKLKIIEDAKKAIMKEEKKSGKKIELPNDIKRQLFNYKI